MTTPVFGVTFGPEVIAAGLADIPVSWCWEPDTGVIHGRENLTDEQNKTLDEVVAAHDPTAQLPNPVADLMQQVTDLRAEVAELRSKRRKKEE